MKSRIAKLLLVTVCAILLVCCAHQQMSLEGFTYSSDKVSFQENLAELSSQSYETLNKTAAFVRSYPDITFKIVCYVYSKGDSLSNYILAGRRAAEIKNYLISRGVDFHQLIIRGFGNSHPVQGANGAVNIPESNRTEFLVQERKVKQNGVDPAGTYRD